MLNSLGKCYLVPSQHGNRIVNQPALLVLIAAGLLLEAGVAADEPATRRGPSPPARKTQNVAPSTADPSSDRKGFINSLLKRLEDRKRNRGGPLPDPWQDAVQELSREFIHDLLVTLREGDPKQRVAAARALRGRLHQDLWAKHIAPLALDADHFVRANVRELLWEVGPETETAAALAFATRHRLATAHRVELIDRVKPGDAFSAHLFPALYEDTEPRIRWALLRAINRLRLDDVDTKRFLANAWYAPDPELRNAVAETLENLQLSLDARLLVDAAIVRLQESRPEDRDSVHVFKRLIRSELPVLQALERTLEHTRSAAVRAAIAEMLSRIGASDPDALSLLVRLLRHDPSADVRAVAAREMGFARADRGRALLELGDALQDEDQDVRVQLAIVSSIRALAPGDADLLRSLDDLEHRLTVIATAESLRDLINEAGAIRNEMRAHQLRTLEAITVR